MAEKSILAAVDLEHEESDKQVAAEALGLARSHNAELHIVFVIPDQHHSYVQNYVSKEMKAQVEVDASNELKAFAEAFDIGDTPLKLHICRGSVYEEIVRLSDKIGADFAVVGSNKPGLKDIFMGPNAARVARNAECSVLIVRPPRGN